MLIGPVSVQTSDYGGLSPEQIAKLCADRIIAVGDKAPPEIAQQAQAFKQHILEVILHYVTLAAQEDRATVCAMVDQQGYPEISRLIRSL